LSGEFYCALQKYGKHWDEHPQDFHLYRRDTRITGSEFYPLVVYLLHVLDSSRAILASSPLWEQLVPRGLGHGKNFVGHMLKYAVFGTDNQ